MESEKRNKWSKWKVREYRKSAVFHRICLLCLLRHTESLRCCIIVILGGNRPSSGGLGIASALPFGTWLCFVSFCFCYTWFKLMKEDDQGVVIIYHGSVSFLAIWLVSSCTSALYQVLIYIISKMLWQYFRVFLICYEEKHILIKKKNIIFLVISV